MKYKGFRQSMTKLFDSPKIQKIQGYLLTKFNKRTVAELEKVDIKELNGLGDNVSKEAKIGFIFKKFPDLKEIVNAPSSGSANLPKDKKLQPQKPLMKSAKKQSITKTSTATSQKLGSVKDKNIKSAVNKSLSNKTASIQKENIIEEKPVLAKENKAKSSDITISIYSQIRIKKDAYKALSDFCLPRGLSIADAASVIVEMVCENKELTRKFLDKYVQENIYKGL